MNLDLKYWREDIRKIFDDVINIHTQEEEIIKICESLFEMFEKIIETTPTLSTHLKEYMIHKVKENF